MAGFSGKMVVYKHLAVSRSCIAANKLKEFLHFFISSKKIFSWRTRSSKTHEVKKSFSAPLNSPSKFISACEKITKVTFNSLILLKGGCIGAVLINAWKKLNSNNHVNKNEREWA